MSERTSGKYEGFSAEERAAMKDLAREQKKAARPGGAGRGPHVARGVRGARGDPGGGEADQGPRTTRRACRLAEREVGGVGAVGAVPVLGE